MTRCPRCGREPDEVIETGPADHPSISYFCDTDRLVWSAETPPRLLDPPTDEARRRDLA